VIRKVAALAVLTAVLTASLLEARGERSLTDIRETRARRRVIGRSVRGQAIRAYRIGERSSRHTVLVVGCIHGNECAARAILRALRDMTPFNNLDLWLVYSMNPDGTDAGTRQNARGVDLNRNFRRDWRPIGEPWDTYYSGPRPFSEPESRTARDFLKDIRPEITIWYHQAMAIVVRTRRHRPIQRRYARAVGLPLRRIGFLPGTATRWQKHRWPNHLGFVVELPGGRLSRRAARRHARAVVDIGRILPR
jgi:murein peptide amidase A